MPAKKINARKAKSNRTKANTKGVSQSKRTAKKKAPVSRRVAAPPYNPLAWMEAPTDGTPSVVDESNTKTEEPVEMAEVPSSTESVTEVPTEQMATAEDPALIEDNVDAEQEAAAEQEDTVVSNQENGSNDEGFGFFEQEPKAEVIAEAKADDDEGFGFFEQDSTPGADVNVKAEDEEGFGFFSDDDDGDAINLGASLTIKNVDEWHSRLVALLEEPGDICFQASDIDQIDGCGLQLLCSFFKTAQTGGINPTWKGASPRFCESAAYFGVANELGVDAKKEAA